MWLLTTEAQEELGGSEQCTAPCSAQVPPGPEEPLCFLRDIWMLNSFLTVAFPSSPVFFKMTSTTKITFD